MPNDTHNSWKFGVNYARSPDKVIKDEGRVFLFTDRGLYKPGETVTFRGIDRNFKMEGNSIFKTFSPYTGGYKLEVEESRYNAEPFYITDGQTTETGGFHGTIELPEDIQPGYYRIRYKRGNISRQTSFQVAHFRRLSFQVKSSKPDITYYKGDKISAKITASYLAGGSMSGARYDYYWSKGSRYFKPAGVNWQPYRFGPDSYDSHESLSSGEGVLGPDGSANIKQKAEGRFKKGLTYLFTMNANVEDIDRQIIGKTVQTIVHPASFYIGLKFESADRGWWSPFVEKGEKVTTNFALVTPEGDQYDLQDGDADLTARLFRVDWKLAQQQGVYGRVNTRWERVETLESEQEISAGKALDSFDIKTENSGSYILEVEVSDEKG
ncbi:MAG: alpha-2-macroglobulin, partial [bacterium]|nr:alpha-2-macroglobulin [bacterium]